MSLDLSGVHVFKKTPGTNSFRLVDTKPLMRLCSGSNVVFIQHGRYWTPGGDPIPSKELPEWARVELTKVSQAALAECGIHRKGDQADS